MSTAKAVRIVAAIALVAVTLGGARPAAAANELTVTAQILRGATPTTEVRRNEAVTIRVTVTNTTTATATITGITLPTRTGLEGTAAVTLTPATIGAGLQAQYLVTGLRGSMQANALADGVKVVAAATGTVPDNTLLPPDADTAADDVSGTSPEVSASLVSYSLTAQLIRGTTQANGFLAGEPATLRLTFTSSLDDPITIDAGAVSVTPTNLGTGSSSPAATVAPNATAVMDITGFTAGPGSPASATVIVNATVPDNTLQPNDGGGAADAVPASAATASVPVGTLSVATTLLRGPLDTAATAFFAGEAVKVRVTVTSDLPAALTVAAGAVTLPTRTNLTGTASSNVATVIPTGAQTTTFDITGLTAGPDSPITVVSSVTGTLPDNTLDADADAAPDTVTRTAPSVSATVVKPTLTFAGEPLPPGPVERGSTIVVRSTITNPPGAPTLTAGVLGVTAPTGTTISTATFAPSLGTGFGPEVSATVVGNTATAPALLIAGGSSVRLTVTTTVNLGAEPIVAAGDLVYTTSFNSATLPAGTSPTAPDLAYELTQADLQMLVNAPAGPEQLDPDDVDITVAYSVDNVGGNDAVGVRFNAPAPTGAVATGLPVTENGWTCAAATAPATGVDCTLAGSLTAAATPPVVNITWTVSTTGTIPFTATVSSTTFDPATGNNTGTDNIAVSVPEAPVILSFAPVAPVIVASDVNATVPIRYTISNGGTKNIKATITFEAPPGGTLSSVSFPGSGGGPSTPLSCTPSVPTTGPTTCTVGQINKATGPPESRVPGQVTIDVTYTGVPQSAFVDPDLTDLEPGIATFGASIAPVGGTFQTGSVIEVDVPVEGKAPRVDIGLAPLTDEPVVNVEHGRILTATPAPVVRTFTFQNFSSFPILLENEASVQLTLPAGVTLHPSSFAPGGPCSAALLCRVGGAAGTTVDGGTAAAPGTRSLTLTFLVASAEPVQITAESRMKETVNRRLEELGTANSQSFTIDINRRPKANNEIGPSIPAGGVFNFTPTANGSLHEDTDNDPLTLKTREANDTAGACPGTAPSACVVSGGDITGLSYVINNLNQLQVTFTGTATPADPSVPVTVTINYLVSDGPAPKEAVPSSVKLRFLPAVAFKGNSAVTGSFGTPVADAVSFGAAVGPERMALGETTLELLKDDLGENAAGTAFPTAGPGVDPQTVRSYDIGTAPAGSVGRNVTPPTGDTPIQRVDSAEIAGKHAVKYVAPRAYTSQPPTTLDAGLTDAPPDDFRYQTVGMKSAVQIYTVEIPVEVEIKNQNPIGIDSLIDVPNGVTQTVFPAGNDIDGNTLTNNANPPVPVKITTRTSGGDFIFDDEGEEQTEQGERRRLKITCIGPLPPAAELPDFLATADPSSVCPSDQNAAVREGWKRAGDKLELKTDDSQGTVAVTLEKDGANAFRGVVVSADATVVGELDFGYVVVDNYGGAGFAKATVKVPNTPPEVIEGVRTVLKNTPTVVVDTSRSVRDVNGDELSIEIQGFSEKTEHGTAKIGENQRTIIYTPNRDYLGPDKLIYNVTDSRTNGSASATLQLNVVEVPGQIREEGRAGGSGAGSPAGNLAATGGDPLALILAAGSSLLLGLAMVHAGRRRRSLPLLERAHHLRT